MAPSINSRKQKHHPLIGSWVSGDEYVPEIEYIITRPTNHFIVRAVDRYDGEEGRVNEVKYDDDTSTLSFDVYWESTGRLVRARVSALSQNRISYTYTFTENQIWFRKGIKSVKSNKSPKRNPTAEKRNSHAE